MVIIVLSVLSIAAGVGGGTIITPLYMILFNFNTKEALAFSNA
jgi:uncharacterized membrane protein YfcA